MNRISPKAKIGRDVQVGDFTIVHDNVRIGDGTVVESHCVLGAPTALAEGEPLVIGEASHIRSHSVFYEGSSFGAGLSTGNGVIVREKCRAGKCLQIGSHTDIEGDCTIGHYTKMHSEVHVTKNTRLGSFIYLFPRVQMTSDPYPPSTMCDGITIGDMAVVCTGALLLPAVKIGLGSFVAAASVVKSEVPELVCVSGNPARVLCRLDQFISAKYGKYHPWVERFKDKYPPESRALMRKCVAAIDARLSAAARRERRRP